jgi:hypothetical protein
MLIGYGEIMTGNKHNPEGNSNSAGEPDPGPYWRRMHRDWRFWIKGPDDTNLVISTILACLGDK